MDWALVDDTSGVSAEDTALSGFGPDPTYNWVTGSSRTSIREVSPA